MTNINNLSSTDTLYAGDLLPVWRTDNGDTRKTSLTTLTDYLNTAIAPTPSAWVDTPSGTTTDLTLSASSNQRITGTTTITSFGTAAAGTERTLRFAAALTLTYNATSLILPGAANVTTAANDTAIVVSLGSGNWICTNYERAVGPVAAGLTEQVSLATRFGATPAIYDAGPIYGDDTTSNASTLDAVVASSYRNWFIPRGTFYDPTSTGLIEYAGKRFYGEGKLHAGDGDYSPPDYAALLTDPTPGPSINLPDQFKGDLWFVDARRRYIGPNVGKTLSITDLNYYNPIRLPNYYWFEDAGGNSGVSGRLTAIATAGVTTTLSVSGTDDVANGVQIAITSDDGATTELKTVLSFVANTSVTFSTPVVNSYAIGANIRRYNRTNSSWEMGEFQPTGGGDKYIAQYRLYPAYPPKTGLGHPYLTQTSGLFSFDWTAGSNLIYGQTLEGRFTSGAFDVHIEGIVQSFTRSTASGGNTKWVGAHFISDGTQSCDVGLAMGGKWNVALDTVLADLGANNTVVRMSNGQVLGNWGATATPDGFGYVTYGNTVGPVNLAGSANGAYVTGGGFGAGIAASSSSWLKVAAGTTARAAVNFTTGVAPTSPATGDWWFDGTDHKARISSTSYAVALREISQTFSGDNTFSGSTTHSGKFTVTKTNTGNRQGFELVSTLPGELMEETDAAADAKKWQRYANGGVLTHAMLNDAETDAVSWLTVTRSGYSGASSYATWGVGLVVGAPTGGNKGAGTANFQNDIYKNNTAYTNPDYVFEHFYRGEIVEFAANEGASEYTGLMPLDDLREFTRETLHLPQVPNTGGVGVFARADYALRAIEENTLYILQLHERLAALEALLKSQTERGH